MRGRFLPFMAFGLAFAMQTGAAPAQVDESVPGGATGADVHCIEAGDLRSGVFVGTYVQTGAGAWEEVLKAGAFRLTERKRDDLSVELFDDARSASVQFDFVNRTIKYKAATPSAKWQERYYMLNATPEESSSDCAASAALRGSDRPPPNPSQMTTIAPKTVLNIPPGTEFSAVRGPPCPNQPGFFLCPNKFSCAPIGGVCCPGAGSCNAGSFCDQYIAGNCVAAGDPRFCRGSGNIATGLALHCAPGMTCGTNNLCQ
jgi:hypothetical protein